MRYQIVQMQSPVKSGEFGIMHKILKTQLVFKTGKIQVLDTPGKYIVPEFLRRGHMVCENVQWFKVRWYFRHWKTIR